MISMSLIQKKKYVYWSSLAVYINTRIEDWLLGKIHKTCEVNQLTENKVTNYNIHFTAISSKLLYEMCNIHFLYHISSPKFEFLLLQITHCLHVDSSMSEQFHIIGVVFIDWQCQCTVFYQFSSI